MASRNFDLNEDPHVAKVGKHTFLFLPEVVGSKFATAYGKLRETQKKLGGLRPAKASSTKHAREEQDVDPVILAEVSDGMVDFLCAFLVDDSERERFRGASIPDRVLAELLEWVAELYGGGSGNPDADGGTSSS